MVCPEVYPAGTLGTPPHSNCAPHGGGYWGQWAVPCSPASAPGVRNQWGPSRQAGKAQSQGTDLLFAGARAWGPLFSPVPEMVLLSLSPGVGQGLSGSRKAAPPSPGTLGPLPTVINGCACCLLVAAVSGAKGWRRHWSSEWSGPGRPASSLPHKQVGLGDARGLRI